MQALPYILTVVVLVGFIGTAVPFKAGGQRYVKERGTCPNPTTCSRSLASPTSL